MNKDNLIEFAKEQCEIFPEDSFMGEYLRETLKMLQAEPCEDAVSRAELLKIYEDGFVELQKIKHLKDNIGANDRQLGVNWCINTLKDLPPVQPKLTECEDCVSREDVIKAIDRHTFDTDDGLCLDEDISIILEELPPVKSTQNWIPVSERLPKPFTFVCATCRSLVDDRENWVVETMYLPIPKENNERGYSDWGDIPVLNWGKAEVIAWMERKIPKPYKESEEE